MVITDAIKAVIALLDNCVLPDSADFTQHSYYQKVRFVPAYPLGTLDVPVVAFSPAGGASERKGLGHWERWHGPRIQMDVLAETSTYARRIFEKVCEVLLYDYNDGAGAGDGTYGSLYLYGQGLKTVEIGEPQTAVWDEKGKVARIVADVHVTFTD